MQCVTRELHLVVRECAGAGVTFFLRKYAI